jgi:hypothetical protein
MAMRRAILLGVTLAVALGTSGAQRVTVQQLERILGSSGPAPTAEATEIGETDLLDQINREDSLAPRIASLELTERLTGLERAQLAAKYKLGPLTRSALELLADRSAFLDPPESEVPHLPLPDAQAQKAMLRQAGEFVFQTLTHLPDFFAVLNTTQFDDGPVMMGGQMLASVPGMHMVGSSEREITFREGKEFSDSSHARVARRDEGLESQGEFGSEAAIVFLDLAHGGLAFHHWEKSGMGTVAVFRYSVPQEGSHYEVKSACHGKPSFHAQPGYHGTLSIDPATGVLMRFTVQAESSPGDPITQVGSAIDYGTVVLGDHRYYCPVRSLALTVEEADTCKEARKRKLTRPVTMLNRIVFSDYHRLGSEMVIVPGAQQQGKPGQDADKPDAAQPDAKPQTVPPSLVPPSN